MIGNIIVINGGSSVGKTTLARTLQAKLREPHLLTGGDIFFLERPPFFLSIANDDEPLTGDGYQVRFKDGLLHEVTVGPLALRWNEEMFHTVAHWADRGNHVIVDAVLHGKALAEGMLRGLGDRPVFHIGISCPLEVAISWEKARGDRALGGAAYFHPLVHGHYPYDLEIDTSATPTDIAVDQIITALGNRGFSNSAR